jgi:hypothetical protein
MLKYETMTEEELKERVEEIVSSWEDSTAVENWNEYCDRNNYYDDRIEYNDIDELLCGYTKPSEVLNKIGSDYDMQDDYAVFTIYGLESFNYLDEGSSPYDVETLADYIIENKECFGDSDLEELFEEEVDEADEPADIDSDMGYDPYMGMITDEV